MQAVVVDYGKAQILLALTPKSLSMTAMKQVT